MKEIELVQIPGWLRRNESNQFKTYNIIRNGELLYKDCKYYTAIVNQDNTTITFRNSTNTEFISIEVKKNTVIYDNMLIVNLIESKDTTKPIIVEDGIKYIPEFVISSVYKNKIHKVLYYGKNEFMDIIINTFYGNVYCKDQLDIEWDKPIKINNVEVNNIELENVEYVILNKDKLKVEFLSETQDIILSQFIDISSQYIEINRFIDSIDINIRDKKK